MNKLEILPAVRKDLPGILDLVTQYERYDVEYAKRYYEIYFRKNKITEEDEVYIAKVDGKIVGVIGFSRDYFATDRSYWLGWFIVHEDYRAKKEGKLAIAQRLLKKVELELKARRKKILFVSTEDTNRIAKSFYAKNKFRTEGILRDYYGRGEDQLILSKRLSRKAQSY